MGRGCGHGYPSLRHDQFVVVVWGDILNREHLDKIFRALAGDGSGDGKAKGGGGGIVHCCHVILSRSCHMPPKYCCVSGEEKEETVEQSDSSCYKR